ncbi:MAG: HupE/UreJ family protein [Cyclobacteriaceae bacterium]
MSTFILYFRLGYRHVLDIYGVDHILFIIAIMSVFLLRDWRRALILFMFYVLGSSLSLSLSVNNIFQVDINIVDYLIPVTLLVAAVINIFKKSESYTPRSIFRFITIFTFGFIHGYGYADYLKDILGTDLNLAVPIIGFNLGVELGLLLVALVFLMISWIFVNNLGISRRDWNLVISSGIAGIALTLMFESRYWL